MSVCVSEDGKILVSGSADNKTRVYRLESGRYALKETLDEAQDFILSVHMSRDNQTLVSGSYDAKVRIYRLRERPKIS